ncbi:unnamed protein product [Symbiodinium pilosum]|uniref:Uncharacterized protein n=1 Tax=Symbiodinium pilosum TaxID=2952 RepID=A0A812WTZ3_SYMPI|nr:unnamed protein product [Symbiodinium pilosum]
MKSWKIVAIFLFQAIGLKYQEQDDPFCEGDLLSKTKVFQCDEQEEKMCQDKYTMVNPEMYTQCQLINGECLARGPPCKDLGISGLTCSSLSECEGKGWKKTWTSGTDTKFSKALGSWVLLGYVKDNGEMSHAWFFKTPESWKSTHPYKLQHKGDMIKAIRHWGRICLREKTPPSGGWKCDGKGNAEIDFPYVRGYGSGNGCGSSSLSSFNWNAGTNFCSQGFKVLIMTTSARYMEVMEGGQMAKNRDQQDGRVELEDAFADTDLPVHLLVSMPASCGYAHFIYVRRGSNVATVEANQEDVYSVVLDTQNLIVEVASGKDRRTCVKLPSGEHPLRLGVYVYKAGEVALRDNSHRSGFFSSTEGFCDQFDQVGFD